MTRDDRDLLLLRVLRDISAPAVQDRSTPTWVWADSVARTARVRGADLSALGAGRILSRLAREGRVVVESDGAQNRYAHPDWAAG